MTEQTAFTLVFIILLAITGVGIALWASTYPRPGKSVPFTPEQFKTVITAMPTIQDESFPLISLASRENMLSLLNDFERNGYPRYEDGVERAVFAFTCQAFREHINAFFDGKL